MNTRLGIALALLAVGALGAQGQQAPPQEPPPVFRVQVDAVEIDAFVTDAQGNPVTDLTADDFEVIDAGEPQTITSFALVNIPIERAERALFSPTAIEPDVATNAGGEGRLYVIALDEVPAALALRTRHFLRRFLEEHFASNDVAALVYVGRGRSGDTQDFTSNRRLLLEALDRFGGGFATEAAPPLMPTLDAGAAPTPGLDAGAPLDAEAGLLSRSRMRALRELVEFMAGVRGRRKSVLYVSTGIGDVYDILDYNGGTRSIAFDDLHATMTAATRGNVSIYPIDPTGLSPGGGLGDAEAAPETDAGADLARMQGLRAMAEATGGFALVNSNSFDAAFTRVVRENSSYYVLGFTSTNDRRDGRYQQVQVRVKRPGLVVRARDGYLAPMGRTPAPTPVRGTSTLPAAVAASLASPIPNPSVPMRLFAAPFKGPDRSAAVAIALELDANALDLLEENGAFVGELAVATTAIAAGGKVHPGERVQVTLTLRPGTFERAKAGGLRMLSEMELPPGRYQLRVAGGTTTGRAGSIVYDLEVPDFTKEPLMMSGLALSSASAAAALTIRPHDPLRDFLPGPVTAVREFAPDDTIAIYTEVYENLRRAAAHTVDLRVELRSDDGRVLSTTSEERSSTELGGTSGGYGFMAQVPLDDATPGIYVIHVEARANIGARPTVSRDIQIRVR